MVAALATHVSASQHSALTHDNPKHVRETYRSTEAFYLASGIGTPVELVLVPLALTNRRSSLMVSSCDVVMSLIFVMCDVLMTPLRDVIALFKEL